MQTDFGYVTDSMFQSELENLVKKMSVSELLAVPGVYTALAEHLHNDVLDAFAIEPEYIGDMFYGFTDCTSHFYIKPAEPDNIRDDQTWGEAFAEGAIFRVKDAYGDGYIGDLSLELVYKKLYIVQEKYPHIMTDMINKNDDICTHEVLFQTALFGEGIYG